MTDDKVTNGTPATNGPAASGTAAGPTPGDDAPASGTAGRMPDGRAGERVRLTALSHGAGFACKLPLSALDQLMATLGTGPGGLVPATGDLLVGAAEGDERRCSGSTRIAPWCLPPTSSRPSSMIRVTGGG